MKNITFSNVTITVYAATAKEAYDKLAGLLADENVEYNTTDYCEDDGEVIDTEELFPSIDWTNQ